MKKIFGISLLTVLAAMPMMANAEPVAGNPAQMPEGQAATATISPKYGLAEVTGNENKVATAGYVKGAYNAAIKAVNRVYDTANNAAVTANNVMTVVNNTVYPAVESNASAISGLQSDVSDLQSAIAELESGTVTQADVDATVNSATANYTPAGTVSSATIETVTAWGVDGEGADTIVIEPTFTGTAAVINPTVPQEP